MGLPLDQQVRDTDAIDEAEATKSEMVSTEGQGQSAWRFRMAVLRHHKAIFRVCYGILGDAHEAEDVTQETFLRYWQLSAEVRGVKAWLVTVARNRCLDRLRAVKKFVDVDPEVFEQEADPDEPERQASRDEKIERLNRLIANLPEPQRSLIVLFDIEGLTGAECAEALKLNVNQVKVYLHRARRQLRRALEDHHD
jgi:RNA polymerase sigma-70 factor, ECF subfamily